MAKYLVTGGAGFIGSNIAEELVKRGDEVVVLDDLSTGHEKNIEHFRSEVTFIEGDIRDPSIVKEALDSVDYVLHQAALASVPRSIEKPVLVNEVVVALDGSDGASDSGGAAAVVRSYLDQDGVRSMEAHDVRRRIQADPMALGLRSATLLSFFVTAVLSLVGFGTHFYLSTVQVEQQWIARGDQKPGILFIERRPIADDPRDHKLTRL